MSIRAFVYLNLFGFIGMSVAAGTPITRIWLTHSESTPETLTVNWESPVAGPSRVEFGPDESLGASVESEVESRLHHVVVPFPKTGDLYYRVRTGVSESAIHDVKSYGADELRVAVVADWQDYPSLDALLADGPHLLISCGDLVHGLVRADKLGDKTFTDPFSHVIGQYPALFSATPFMPLLGNHDRQLFPRFLKPPAEPIFDLEATAFLSFFPLPAPGWNWHLDIPDFGLRFIALDLSHTRDAGTTWQSCQPFGADSAQLAWFRDRMTEADQPFVLTLYNEWHHLVNKIADGAWMPIVQQGSAAVSGFGLFAERAEYGGIPCFNTALQTGEVFGNGSRTQFHETVQSYLLITFKRDRSPMKVEIKNLAGATLDATIWPARSP